MIVDWRPRLDRRIDIEAPTETVDAVGQPVRAWATLEAGVPAQFTPVTGREQLQAMQVLASATARFIVRHRTDLNRKMRIAFEGGRWNVRHFETVERFGRDHYLMIYAELIAAA